jgi:3-hydroxybutyryl-CoA dehydrogenase
MIKIGILGAGSMGSGIAQVAATAGHEVIVFDTFEHALGNMKTRLDKILNRLIEKGRINEATREGIVSRIHYGQSMEDFADCGLVIEAIIENIDIKKKVFAQLEAITDASAILASNTSSLSIASIAAACQNANRVIGIHFFNPAPLMKLVEIIPAIQTSKETETSAKNIIDSWGKLTVLVKDTPGFIVNRIARPFYGEALRILEEGIADVATIDWAMTAIGGFRMGPFTLMDYIGNDINYTVTETVFKAFYYDQRYKPAFTQKRLSEAGYYGRKAGRGYYDYSKNAVKSAPNEDKDLGEIIVNRVVCMLINEAVDALFWQVATQEDIETAMTKGVNYPKGLLAWADEKGLDNVLKTLEGLQAEYGEDRYRPSPLLRKMVREDREFKSL